MSSRSRCSHFGGVDPPPIELVPCTGIIISVPGTCKLMKSVSFFPAGNSYNPHVLTPAADR